MTYTDSFRETGTLPSFLRVKPEYRDYVWGGRRLCPDRRVAEAWVVDSGNVVADGPFAGLALADLVERFGAALLGRNARPGRARRFPLLLKLLDCRQWLSLQVHPNDEQAARLEHPQAAGKTEAWHILDAAPESHIIAGFTPGVDKDRVVRAIGKKDLLDLAQCLPMESGSTVLIPAGTLHALGPGLLVYEIQQSSDLTYRVYDWDRPATDRRRLHLDQAADVLDVSRRVRPIPCPAWSASMRNLLCETEYFRLEMVLLDRAMQSVKTGAHSFHLVTLVEGQAEIRAANSRTQLEVNGTVIVPAITEEYSLRAEGKAKLLVASVPPRGNVRDRAASSRVGGRMQKETS